MSKHAKSSSSYQTTSELGSSSGHSSGRRRSHRDPSQGGWDVTITKAPDSHKRRKKRRKHKRWPKVVAGILIALLVIGGGTAAALFMYKKSIDDALSLGKDSEAINAVLTDVPASKPFYALIMGSDLRGATVDSTLNVSDQFGNGTGFSDVIMLVRVDAAKSKVTLLTIPRDTPIQLPSGEYVKLNYAYHQGGAPQLISTVEGITGVKISHYAEISAQGLEDLVNGLGGITANVPQSFSYTTMTGESVYLEQGQQLLNGAEALALANMRTQYAEDQEFNRQNGARQVVLGIINAIKSRPAFQIPGAVADAAACVRTDMVTDDLIQIVQMMGTSPSVLSGTAPYKGSLDLYTSPTHSEADSIWLCYVNEEGWKRVVGVVDSGEDPKGVSYDADVVHYAGQPEETWSQGLVAP